MGATRPSRAGQARVEALVQQLLRTEIGVVTGAENNTGKIPKSLSEACRLSRIFAVR